MRALVIDDSRAMRMVLTRQLSGLGFEVLQAHEEPGPDRGPARLGAGAGAGAGWSVAKTGPSGPQISSGTFEMGPGFAAEIEAGEDLPVLATVDWNMPVMDGLTFVQTIRQRPEWRQISLMMVTTESEQGQIVRALAAGAHEYLIKPFGADAFSEKLDLLGLNPARSIA